MLFGDAGRIRRMTQKNPVRTTGDTTTSAFAYFSACSSLYMGGDFIDLMFDSFYLSSLLLMPPVPGSLMGDLPEAERWSLFLRPVRWRSPSDLSVLFTGPTAWYNGSWCCSCLADSGRGLDMARPGILGVDCSGSTWAPWIPSALLVGIS